jgi:hypothetical protein
VGERGWYNKLYRALAHECHERNAAALVMVIRAANPFSASFYSVFEKVKPRK